MAFCFGVYAAGFYVYTSTAAIVASLGAVVAYLAVIARPARHLSQAPLRKLSAIGLIVAVLLLSAAIYRKFIAEHEVGRPSEYDAFMRPCGTIDRAYLAGRLMATLREVECAAGPMIPPSRNYFVFVHLLTGHNDFNSLVLGYRVWADGPAWRIEPTLRWLDRRSLQIAMGAPSFITLQRTHMDAIGLSYVPGGIDIGDRYRLASCSRDWCDHNANKAQ